MAAAHFTNLLIVAAAGLLAPLALGFFPRVRVPAIVLEILLGVVIGPSVLGWVKPDLPVAVLALLGLAFLLFLAGLEFDVERLRGRVLKLTAVGFGVSQPEHYQLLRDRCDAVVVGSAIVRAIGEGQNPGDIVRKILGR